MPHWKRRSLEPGASTACTLTVFDGRYPVTMPLYPMVALAPTEYAAFPCAPHAHGVQSPSWSWTHEHTAMWRSSRVSKEPALEDCMGEAPSF